MGFGNTWDPFSNVIRPRDRQVAPNAHAVGNTKVDWRETPEAHIFKVDTPGLKKEELIIELLEERTLEISGESKKEEEQKKEEDTWICAERSTGSFSRRFHLPENSIGDEVHAQVQDGVLTVEMPKVQLKPRVRRFEISEV